MKVTCFHCKKTSTFESKIGFREECSHCRSDLHVCKNCEFYDPKVYNECRETAADIVRDKERSQFCDFFSPHQNENSVTDKAAQLRAAAEALFKKS
ncbi:MAG: hypothetical protein A2622_10485 [Bdellovibrionales bacterium RIFCSPHIGHO2_01_FULL_40_29]|nr:MAG: hypothetical protein A2622_10485 [Bdellovibrionales bacterium RIFCSPHIGHO2_01_FULL_40_29]OFZ34387.1 MAG: hypothetical protein A3D17_00750 [Bdellovibrionales bacterium RIFCSPHIGHO2_02_FULL_40_15]